ncbi:NTF2-like protein [Hymenopellis radicata]|nr:NTF2-like protein [Hymenopellis radicata]
MFSSPTPAPGSLASQTLRKAGLMDGDATMRDVSGSKHQARKAKPKGHKARAIDGVLGGSSRASTLPGRLGAASSSIAIRGAGRKMAVDIERRRRALNNTGGPILSTPRVKGPQLDQWKELVESRYDRQNQFLNLSNMIEDPIVKKYNLKPPGRGGTAKEAAVIFKLAKGLTPPVTKLDLSNNHLAAEHLTLLAHYLTSLDALSLKDNDIRSFKELEHVTGRAGKERFSNLQELMLGGNPLHVQQYEKGHQDSYKAEVVRRFPTITMLDQEPMALIVFDTPSSSTSAVTVSKPSATSFPVEMQSSNISGVSGDLVTNFLFRFFDAFDKNRMALVDVYDGSCTFSFSANTAIPERARIQGFQVKLPNQKSLDWKVWLDNAAGGSRNLTRLRQWVDKHDDRLKIGNEDTVRSLLQLPATDHALSGSAENFCVDTMAVPHGANVGLLVIIHGQFKELPSEGLRSFDRSFVLAPATEGSRARANGWDVVILSDHWTIRNYSSPESWRPGPMLVQAQKRPPIKKKALEPMATVPAIVAPTTSNPAQPVAQYPIPPAYQPQFLAVAEPQRLLLIQICQATNLIPQFGQDCLEKNNYDMAMAMSNFEAVRGSLGANAYMQQS